LKQDARMQQKSIISGKMYLAAGGAALLVLSHRICPCISRVITRNLQKMEG
jgi:hypothetical protein